MNIKMEEKPTDINDLVSYLTGTSMKPLLDDDLWRCYGYRKRPVSGAIFSKLFPKRHELENFITKEVLTMGIIDVLNGIKKSNLSPDDKLLVSLGVVDQFLVTTKHLFTDEIFMDNLFTAYDSFLKSEKSKLYTPSILKAKTILNKQDFAKYMVGTIRLLSEEHVEDFLLKSNALRDTINRLSGFSEAKLNIVMSEIYHKYGSLIQKNILSSS